MGPGKAEQKNVLTAPTLEHGIASQHRKAGRAGRVPAPAQTARAALECHT